VWHASVSLQNRKGPLDDEPTVERFAIDALTGVGGPTEWWLWNPTARVGHLRVPVTDTENELVPPGCAVDDAGPEGQQRPRTTRP
jgi:hypothetical protein